MILGFNVVLFLVAISILGVDAALYSTCVVTRLAIGRVRTIVREFDAGAFMVFHPLSGVEGGVMKPKAFH